VDTNSYCHPPHFPRCKHERKARASLRHILAQGIVLPAYQDAMWSYVKVRDTLTHTHPHKRTCARTHSHANTHKHTYTHTHTHTLTYTHTFHICTYRVSVMVISFTSAITSDKMVTRAHAHVHTHAHTHARTHTHTHAHTHTCCYSPDRERRDRPWQGTALISTAPLISPHSPHSPTHTNPFICRSVKVVP
jgi:hypothetical protein